MTLFMIPLSPCSVHLRGVKVWNSPLFKLFFYSHTFRRYKHFIVFQSSRQSNLLKSLILNLFNPKSNLNHLTLNRNIVIQILPQPKSWGNAIWKAYNKSSACYQFHMARADLNFASCKPPGLHCIFRANRWLGSDRCLLKRGFAFSSRTWMVGWRCTILWRAMNAVRHFRWGVKKAMKHGF